MAKRRIFAVGFDLPGDEFEYIRFDSDQTLLDADIVLFQPTLGDHYGMETFNGRMLLSEHSSFAAKRQIDHWNSEIVAAVNAGKLVIVYLVKPIDQYRYTGEVHRSGSGRSQVTNKTVTAISSYEAVPGIKRHIAKSGSEIRLEKAGAYLASYWNEFSECSPYEVEIEGDFSRALLVSRAGNRIVGAAFDGKSGTLLFLPPLRYDRESFIRIAERNEDEGKSYWTREALRFGKRLVAALSGLSDTLRLASQTTPPPSWSSASEYRLKLESKLEAGISKCDTEMRELQAKKVSLGFNWRRRVTYVDCCSNKVSRWRVRSLKQ
jgi:hypothetical protein